MKKQDKWCMPLERKGKSTISGGAARNVRIAESGGMDSIVANAVDFAFNQANLMSGAISHRLPLQPIDTGEKHLLH
ncbi:hypothetical protein QL898_09645 [Psychrobacter sp. APC 3279]|uniref:hypothetical protein n=1 Tax=Psychrobacter sp. APC 3279 TaxID=3035189 RepID=UPI0025B2ABC9|nr:hypothetical protein [Psychrobacter sp. APC 3279]MDN3441896.1 hypothetical protein [Psychrobacter sp. APC 3279]